MATRYGKLPDEIIYAEEAGWNHWARFAFNDGVTAFVEEFERMRDKTKEVTARRPSHNRTYKKSIPFYTEAQLLTFLGIDPEHERAKAVLRQAVSKDQWDEFIEGDWDAVPEDAPQR